MDLKKLLAAVILFGCVASAQTPYYSIFKGKKMDSLFTDVNNARVFNVKSYGAVGNGVTDDRAAIQHAIDAKDSAGAGIILLPPGVFIVSSVTHPVDANFKVGLILKSNTILRGSGPGRTIIRRAANQANHSALIYNYHVTTADSNITVEDIELDGNSANNPGNVDSVQFGLSLWNTTRATIRNVTVRNVRGTNPDGLTESVCFSAVLCSRLVYQNCYAIGNSVSVTGFSNDASADIHYTDCISYGHSRGMGFTHNSSQNVVYTGCSAYLNGGHGFNSEVGRNILYANCISGGIVNAYGAYPFAPNDTLRNGWSGFRVASSTGPVSLSNCIGSFNDSSGLIVEGYATGVNVIGGRYDYNKEYGIKVYWAQDDYSFSGNVKAEGNGLGPLYLLGDDSYISIPSLFSSMGVGRNTIGWANIAIQSARSGDTSMVELYKPAGGVVMSFSDNATMKTVIGIDTLTKSMGFGTHSSAINEFVLRNYRVGVNTADPDSTLKVVGSGNFTGNLNVDGNVHAGNSIASGATAGHLGHFVTADSIGNGGIWVNSPADTVATKADARAGGGGPGGGFLGWYLSGQSFVTDSLRLIQGSNITLTQSGRTLTVASTGGGGTDTTSLSNRINNDSTDAATRTYVDAKIAESSGGLYTGDASTFATTSTRKAIYISGTTTGSRYQVSPLAVDGTTSPVTGDLLNCITKTDSLVVMRLAGTTSGLGFSYVETRGPIGESSSFSSTNIRKAVYIAGTTTAHRYVVSRLAVNDTTPPDIGDMLNSVTKTDSLIVLRISGTTADLGFSYLRVK
jgi:hypothetical protein